MELKGHLLYYPEGKHDINLDNYVQKSQLNDAIKSKVDSITKTTYADLKNLRDNSQLVPGNLYRITDYQCTTTQENTQSAGHQFDIVLLALSEDKLAEEGWAMEHPNVWTVDFYDGDQGHHYYQCYVYKTSEGVYNVVDIHTLLGMSNVDDYDDIDVDNKTMTLEYVHDRDMIEENLTYNYFQNSNLSAWKVWYCLDNDKSRFAWADDSVDGEPLSIIVSGTFSGMYGEDIKCKRNPLNDATYEGIRYFNFNGSRPGPSVNIYTETLDINSETKFYGIGFNKGIPASKEEYDDVVVSSIIPSTETPNGRGVIYRLIDEFNNDVAYDFKNIQFKRKITNGQYDENGTETWCYTFTWIDANGVPTDASIVAQNIPNDEGSYSGCYNNVIKPSSAYNYGITTTNFLFALNNNVFISTYSYFEGYFFGCSGNKFGVDCIDNTFGNGARNNNFGNSCANNNFANNCDNNIFGNYCSSNVFSDCFGNIFGNGCLALSLSGVNQANYGNEGKELATKDDLN